MDVEVVDVEDIDELVCSFVVGSGVVLFIGVSSFVVNFVRIVGFVDCVVGCVVCAAELICVVVVVGIVTFVVVVEGVDEAVEVGGVRGDAF